MSYKSIKKVLPIGLIKNNKNTWWNWMNLLKSFINFKQMNELPIYLVIYVVIYFFMIKFIIIQNIIQNITLASNIQSYIF